MVSHKNGWVTVHYSMHTATYFYGDENPYTIFPMKYARAFVVLSWLTLRPSHTAQNSRKRMNHAQNLVMRACPSRIWPFLLTYLMKNHRWIAQELRRDHAQITNKPRTSAHRHEKAPNRANTWLCVTNTRRKTTYNQRTVASELRMNRAWFTHELRKECAGGAEVAFIPRI